MRRALLLFAAAAAWAQIVPTATLPDGRLVAVVAGSMWMHDGTGANWAPREFNVRIAVDPLTGLASPITSTSPQAPAPDPCAGPQLDRASDDTVQVGGKWNGCKYGSPVSIRVLPDSGDCHVWVWGYKGAVEVGGSCKTDPASVWRYPPFGAFYLGAIRVRAGVMTTVAPVDRPLEIFPAWGAGIFWGE